MPSHNHKLVDNSSGGEDKNDKFNSANTAQTTAFTVGTTFTGGDADHFHPFRTVLFCRRCPVTGCP